MLAITVLTGCSASTEETATPTSTSTQATIPSDGVTLRSLGFSHGPNTQFSIPQGSVLTTRIDQANVVTLVFAEPSGQTLRDYFVRALPDAGFTIDSVADDALVFSGHGWNGSFITGSPSAVSLRIQ